MDIRPIFSAFIATEIFSFIDNQELKKYAFYLREKEEGVIKSNFLGWQSDILKTPNDQIGLLVDNILEKSKKLKDIVGFKKDSYLYLNHLWININCKSSFNRPHVHPNCVFSGVYYVDCLCNSGKIVFKHPSIAQQYFLDQNLISDYTEFNAASWSVLPETGKLIIFPSWLEHYVEPNLENQERISIAFNIDIKELV
jgi:uncharacterized protein (TIGR02466 family)